MLFSDEYSNKEFKVIGVELSIYDSVNDNEIAIMLVEKNIEVGVITLDNFGNGNGRIDYRIWNNIPNATWISSSIKLEKNNGVITISKIEDVSEKTRDIFNKFLNKKIFLNKAKKTNVSYDDCNTYYLSESCFVDIEKNLEFLLGVENNDI